MRVTLKTMLYSLHVLFHPFDCFWEVKHNKKNTFQAANLLLAIYCAMIIIGNQMTGFLYNFSMPEERNIIMDIFTTIFPILVWSVLNWALSTLLDGKGTIKQIWITTIYAMTPMMLSIIPGILLSNVFTLEESIFYSTLMQGTFYWSMILVIIGNMVIHDYTVLKTLLIAFFSLLGFVAVTLLFVIFFSTFQQLVVFINTVYSEFKYRL